MFKNLKGKIKIASLSLVPLSLFSLAPLFVTSCSSSQNPIPEKPTDPSNPTDPSEPSKPETPSQVEKDFEKTIEQLKGQLKPVSTQNVLPSIINENNFSNYVEGWTSNLNNFEIELVKNSLKSDDDYGTLTFTIKLANADQSFSKTAEITISDFNSNQKIVTETLQATFLEFDSTAGTFSPKKDFKANELGSKTWIDEVNSENLISFIDEFKNIENGIKCSFSNLNIIVVANKIYFTCTFSLGGYSENIEGFGVEGFKVS